MADSIQSPETGGGEGAAPPTSPPQVQKDPKPVEIQQNVANNVAQTQESPAAKPEESKPEKPNPETPKLEELNPKASKPEEPKQEEPKPEEPKAEELKSEVLKPEATKADESKQSDERTAAGQNANKVEQNNAAPKETDWQQRETELLKKIGELEKTKCEKTEDGLKLQLKVREEEIDLLKARVKNLETELQAALSKPNGKNHEMIENIKQQHEELLSKARGMIFDKTKMVKNQELQIEALNTQVQSLKDINQITKDLLQIRNGEIKAMEDRLEAMEARFKVEKERYSLVLQRAQTSTTINDDLKKEYETQLAIFKELREKYELRVKALVAENEKLKGGDSAKGGPSA